MYLPQLLSISLIFPKSFCNFLISVLVILGGYVSSGKRNRSKNKQMGPRHTKKLLHNKENYSPIDEHLGRFHILAIVNSAAVNTGVLISFLISVFVSSAKYPEWNCWLIW